MLTTVRSYKEYEVTTNSGTWYLIAKDSEHAAWSALELTKQRNEKLLNVRLADAW
jgi:hypothetical protein